MVIGIGHTVLERHRPFTTALTRSSPHNKIDQKALLIAVPEEGFGRMVKEAELPFELLYT